MEEAWELAVVRGAIRTDRLFGKSDWFNVSSIEKNRVTSAISALGGERILNTPTDDLVSFFVAEHTMDVPVIDRTEISVEQNECQIDVSKDRTRFIRDPSRPFYVMGTTVTVEVPFSGDGNFFDIEPTTTNMIGIYGSRIRQSIFFEITGTDLTADRVSQEINNRVTQYETYLDRLRSNSSSFNASLEKLVRDQVEQRKTKLLADRNLVSGLGFKMKERSGASKTYLAPEVRKSIRPTLPKLNVEPFKPEPVMSLDDYNNILDIFTNMALVMEQSPSAFRAMGEEDIRTHFLVQLNGHYEGNATGETFNFEGKTDILVKSDGKNIFIAECKFWSGQKGLTKTIDQILGYLSWRDTKASVIVFSRKKLFSDVLKKIPECVLAHPNCKKFTKQRSETSWEYMFSHKNDQSREIKITIMAFNVPTED